MDALLATRATSDEEDAIGERGGPSGDERTWLTEHHGGDPTSHRRLGASPFPEVREQDGVKYIRCRNRANAYSAAWLSPKEAFLKTGYADRLTLEWHSFNLYNQARVWVVGCALWYPLFTRSWHIT